MHTLALEAGDEEGMGWVQPRGYEEAVQETQVGGEKGPVHLVTDVGFAQIKKQIPNSSRFLTVRWRPSVVYEVVQKYTG